MLSLQSHDGKLQGDPMKIYDKGEFSPWFSYDFPHLSICQSLEFSTKQRATELRTSNLLDEGIAPRHVHFTGDIPGCVGMDDSETWEKPAKQVGETPMVFDGNDKKKHHDDDYYYYYHYYY